jgi:hypothetical protein
VDPKKKKVFGDRGANPPPLPNTFAITPHTLVSERKPRKLDHFISLYYIGCIAFYYLLSQTLL